MSSVSDISESNRHWLRWKATAVEWLAVIVAGFAMLLAILALIVNVVSVSVGVYQGHRIDEQQQSLDVYRIRAAKMDAWLKAHGVPTEEIYDE